jgi:hypothetical protein
LQPRVDQVLVRLGWRRRDHQIECGQHGAFIPLRGREVKKNRPVAGDKVLHHNGWGCGKIGADGGFLG